MTWSWQHKDTFLLDPTAIELLEKVFHIVVMRHLQLPASYLVCGLKPDEDNNIDFSFLPELTLILPDMKQQQTSYIQFQVGEPRHEIEEEIRRMSPPSPTSKSKRSNRLTNTNFNEIGLGLSFLFTNNKNAIKPKFLHRLTPPIAWMCQIGKHEATIKLLRFLSETDTGMSRTLFHLGHKPLPTKFPIHNKQEEKEEKEKHISVMNKTNLHSLKNILTKTFNINQYMALSIAVDIYIIIVLISIFLLSTIIYVCQIGYNRYQQYSNVIKKKKKQENENFELEQKLLLSATVNDENNKKVND